MVDLATTAPSVFGMGPEQELALYKEAFEKISTVCLEAARGNFEARITGIKGFGDLVWVFDNVNRLLDLSDAYIRESTASLQYASQGKYYRPFLLRGMQGDFRRGAQEINCARETMEQLEVDMKNQRLSLADEFDASISEVVAAVSNAAETQESTARSMSDSAHDAQSSASSVASAAEEASANVGAVAAAAEQLSASISEISQRMSTTTEATAIAVQQAAAASGSVVGLKDATSRIDQVVDFIRNIAGQTNLLALNATIEAARAGAAGKGFAVVAAEVKVLASQTANATNDIVQQVQAIKDAGDQTVGAIAEIDASIARVNEVAGAIAAAVEEQAAVTNEISANVQQAATGTDDVSRHVLEINDKVASTGTSAREMLSAAGELSRQSTVLGDEVSRFLDKVRNA